MSISRAFQLVLRVFDPRTATEPMIDPLPPKPALPFVSTGSSLPRQRPEQHGISSRHIAQFLQALQQDPTLRMQGIMVLRDGCVLCEAAFGEQELNRPRMTFSACKSITSMAIGILMDDGLLDPEQRLVDIFPKAGNLVNRQLMKNITVSDLLSMQTGNQFNELVCMTQEDWLHGFFSSPSLREKFNYNSLNTYILSRIITQITGKSLSDFLKERLFEPMGIRDYYWELCPKGYEKGGWGLYIRAEDLGKLGQLIHDGGKWNGAQLISEEYLRQATTAHATAPVEYGDFNYGWQFWVGRTERTVLFNGMLGQNVLCFLDSGITLVSHASNDETFQQSNYFSLAAKFFGGSFEHKCPASFASSVYLRNTLRSCAPSKGTRPTKTQFAAFAGKSFSANSANAAGTGLLPLTLQAVQNFYSKGFSSISISGTRSRIQVVYTENDAQYQLVAGTIFPVVQDLSFGGNIFRTAVQAKITRDEDDRPVLRLQLSFLETPFIRTFKIILTPTGALLRQSETPCMDQILDAALSKSHPAITSAIGTIFGTGDLEFLRWKMSLVYAPAVELIEQQKNP